MRHFAFLPSHLEPGQHTLAQRMEREGFDISWIMHTAYDVHWLTQLGVPRDRILDTTLRDEHQYDEADTEVRLRRLESGKPPFLNDVAAMDRRLRHKSDEYTRRYFAHLEKIVTQFLIDRGIQFVSNGRDTALELVCHRICERLGLSSVVPTVIRIPDDRFGFCLGYKDSQFIDLGQVLPGHVDEATQVVEQFRRERPVPSMSLFERRNASFLLRLHRDFVNWIILAYRATFDIGNDVGRYSIGQLLKMFLRRRLNALHVGMAPVFESTGRRPYIMYGLQMQPESSIDVLASHVADQHNLVSIIAKSTPCTHDFYVKPHPDHVGGLSHAQLVALRQIPGVRLISPYLNSHDLICGASIVLTCAGTMGLEAAFYGVPSIVFGDEFFKTLPTVHYCNSLAELPELIPRLIAAPRTDTTPELISFLAYHIANSFRGRVTNYLGPYNEQELETYCRAYAAVYDRLRPVGVRETAQLQSI